MSDGLPEYERAPLGSVADAVFIDGAETIALSLIRRRTEQTSGETSPPGIPAELARVVALVDAVDPAVNAVQEAVGLVDSISLGVTSVPVTFSDGELASLVRSEGGCRAHVNAAMRLGISSSAIA